MESSNTQNFNILLYVLLGIVIVLILYYVLCCTNDKKCTGEFYGPDMIYTYGKNNTDLQNLIARVYNLNNEMVKKPLTEALKTVSNDERIGVFSIDNPVSVRRAIESNESYHKILSPAIDNSLKKNKLKLARNVEDGTIISESVTLDGYDYPIGQWLFVQRHDDIA